MDLPESVLSMQKMLQPMAHMRIGVSPGGGHPLLPPLPGLSPVMPPFPGPGDRRMSRYNKYIINCTYNMEVHVHV